MMLRLTAFLLLPVLAHCSTIAVSGGADANRDPQDAAYSLFLVGDGLSVNLSWDHNVPVFCGACSFDAQGGLFGAIGRASIGSVSSSLFALSFAGPEGGVWTGQLTLYDSPNGFTFGNPIAEASLIAHGTSELTAISPEHGVWERRFEFSADVPEPTTALLVLAGLLSVRHLRKSTVWLLPHGSRG